MEKYKQFYCHIQNVADEFKKIQHNEVIRIVSHLDADGISSCSILIKAMIRSNKQYVVSVVQKLDDTLLESLAKEQYNYIAFTDLGSGQIAAIKEKLKDKRVFIFDHHEVETIEAAEDASSIFHVNPHMFGIDGSKEVSGAGVVYLFAKALDEKNKDMAQIAIIGAIGDIQENSGFERINSEILKDAVETGKIKIIPGLKVFGAQTKPLYKVLEYSSEYNIPGVTGSESGAIQFLHQMSISPKDGSRWRKLVDLTEDELKKLVTGILLRRLNEKKPEAIIGQVYILCEEQKQSPLRDAKEFSTLLNACGRMSKAALGIGVCLSDKKMKEKAIAHLTDYKKEIVKALNWFEESYTANKLSKGENYIIINAGTNVMHTIIGTLASIISKSNYLSEGTLIMSMAQMGDGNTKVSLRACCSSNGNDLRSIMSEIAEKVDGSFGGHISAAGAVISTEKEDTFIEEAKAIFNRIRLTP